MRQRLAVRWRTLGLIWVTCLGVAAAAPQKYRLRDLDRAGDFSRVASEMEMSLDMRVTAGDQVVPSLRFTNRELENYTEEVLTVDRHSATGVRRVYSVARRMETDPAGATKQHVSSLQGKKVAIRRRGEKVVVTSTPGKLAPEDREPLLDDLDNDEAAFFPDRDVAPGDEWVVDPKAAARIFDDVESASIRCRFEEVLRYGGHECARLRMAIDLVGKAEGLPGQITMKLAGDGYYALDLERPLTLDLGGTITLQGRSRENGIDVIYAGDGSFKAKETVRWLKIGGKPVARGA